MTGATQVAITGMGIVSAIGNSADACLHSLLHSQTGISQSTKFLTNTHPDSYLGEVTLSNDEMQILCGEKTKLFDRTTLLAWVAAKEAYRQAEVGRRKFNRKALISATTVGGMGHTEKQYAKYLCGEPCSDFISSHFCGASTEVLAEKMDMRDYFTTISTACSSSANAILHAARLIRTGKADCVLAGGVDPLSLFTFYGFQSLKLLDEQLCRPFDLNRSGLNLGEGAAFFILEPLEKCLQDGAQILGILSGGGNANDAFHETASSPDGRGAKIAMQLALTSAKLKTTDIGYINAHGTGTQNNDASEAAAINSEFGKNIPPVSSTKSFTGHTLAASGAIEAVISLLSLQNQMLFPNLHFETPLQENPLPIISSLKKGNISHVLSNSFGFGGNCTSLIFSKK